MVKAAEIASIWKRNIPGPKRSFIKDIIVAIYNEIPNTKEYTSAQNRLRSILDSLWYKAPEVLNHSWGHIYNFLESYLTLKTDMSKNPQWIKNIVTIWEKGNKELVAHYTDESA